MKILVTGAHGLLGSAFATDAEELGDDVVARGRADLDITDPDPIREALGVERPDWVVHCAAYTAVDRAEANEGEAFRVNVAGAANVASACAESGVRMVYISSDYVFDGTKSTPYLTSDTPNPLSVYGRSKLAGEEAIRTVFGTMGGWGKSPLIVRTGWLYGAGGRGFVPAILARGTRGEPLRVVSDQRGRPTWAPNVARSTLGLMRDGRSGIWHVADGGDATWLELARATFQISGVDAEVEGVTSAAWGAAAPRPAYSVLDLEKSEKALGRAMMHWEEALERFLQVHAA